MKRMQKSISGAILIFVLGMLMILSLLVTAFLQNLHQDLQLHSQFEGNQQLRNTAYNVLEAVRCSVEQQLTREEDFQKAALVEKRLPLPSSVRVHIQIEDESGKIPLHGSDEKQLTNLFRLFADIWDARTLAKQYQQWLQKKPILSTLIDLPNKPLVSTSSPEPSQLPEDDVPSTQKKENSSQIFFPKALNDYRQLQEIEKSRTVFFDKQGNPNAQLQRFMQVTSLPSHCYRVNINSASSDVLTVLSKTFSLDVEAITNYLGLQPHATEKHSYADVEQIQKLGHGKFSSSSEENEKEQPTAQKILTTKPHLLRLYVAVFKGKLSFSIRSLWMVLHDSNPQKKKRSKSSQKEITLKLVELKENE